MEPPKTTRQLGWFGLLMIAVISGLVVKIVGDPLVQVISPKLEDAADSAEDFVDDHWTDRDWSKQLDRWLEDWRDRRSDRSEDFDQVR